LPVAATLLFFVRMPSRRRAWIVLALAAAVLAVAIWREAWPWISDDAFISMRYSERLLAGHGLTWNDGERVEGYSNLSWVLATAGLGWLGMDLLNAVRLLGIAATMLACAVLAFGTAARMAWPAAWVAVLVAAQPTVVLWAIGGLEGPLAMACIGIGVHGMWRGTNHDDATAARRAFASAGAAFAVLVLTRPDAPLWVGAGALTMLLCRPLTASTSRLRWRCLLLLVLPAAIAFAGQTLFRYLYFGDLVANTTRAKLQPSWAALEFGSQYLLAAAESLRSLWSLALLGFAVAWWRRSTRPLAVYALLTLPLWCFYVGLLGGDYFPRNRVFLQTILPLAMLAAVGLDWLAAKGMFGRAFAGALALSAIGLARWDGEMLPQQAAAARRGQQYLSWWEWRGIACGEWLAAAFGSRQPLLALDQVGASPYASRLPCIDMLGLCDRTIAMTPVEASRFALIGHARGNGDYVLSRRPDLVLFLPPPHSPTPTYASGTQMEGDPRFLQGYRLVQFDVDRFDAARCDLASGEPMVIHGWVRLDGKVGHGAWQGDRLTVPAYLLASYRQPYAFGLAMTPKVPGSPGYEAWARDVRDGLAFILRRALLAVLDRAAGRVLAEVRQAGEHRLQGLALPPGRYRLMADLPAGAVLRLEVAGVAATASHGVLAVPSAADAKAVDLVLEVPASLPLPLRIGDIAIERVR
jgi:arabinofuranosyltransferase